MGKGGITLTLLEINSYLSPQIGCTIRMLDSSLEYFIGTYWQTNVLCVIQNLVYGWNKSIL